MAAFTTTCEVRWADLDPLGHARHTAFMDWATHSRLAAFASQGVTSGRFLELGVGPVVPASGRGRIVEGREGKLAEAHGRLAASRASSTSRVRRSKRPRSRPTGYWWG